MIITIIIIIIIIIIGVVFGSRSVLMASDLRGSQPITLGDGAMLADRSVPVRPSVCGHLRVERREGRGGEGRGHDA
jgi:hypothetical protein